MAEMPGRVNVRVRVTIALAGSIQNVNNFSLIMPGNNGSVAAAGWRVECSTSRNLAEQCVVNAA